MLRAPSHIAGWLSQRSLHAKLVEFDRHQLDAFTLAPRDERIFAAAPLYQSVPHFDSELLEVLKMLADGLFINSTNVTYPMKALLLITGFMPALDSQVRKGLQRAGIPGFSGTRYLLPKNTFRAAGRNLCQLPFTLGRCWLQSGEMLTEAVLKSDHPALQSEPGRIFDILLFMQRDPNRNLMLTAG
jgi:hypothetical protein